MTDRRMETPKFAFIEAQIVHRAMHTEAFAQCVRSVEDQYGLASGSLGNGMFFETRPLMPAVGGVPRDSGSS